MRQTVVIIGAGPAGLLLAHYLLRRGKYAVEIYERRPDPRLVDVSQDRTFPISLQERGRKALRAIPGLEAAIATHSVFCQGTMVHRQNRPSRSISRKHPILTIDRNRLVAVLLEQLTRQYPAEQITLHFNCTCQEIDGTRKTITLQPESGDPFSTTYDVLVGADGARSVVREYLVQTSGLACHQEYVTDVYKSLFLQRCHGDVNLESDKIHSWNLDNKTRIILVPQPGDRLNGVLIFDPENNPIASLSTPEAVHTFFQTNFPPLDQLMSVAEAEAFLERPIAKVLTVRCDRFHSEQAILLIGDAAHAVSPSIGQGCNASLEDVWILDQLLDHYADDWSQILPAFSQRRIPDAHALQDLSTYSFPRNKWLVLEFFLRLTIGRRLHQWFPQKFQPFLFDLILETDLSYAEILERSQNWVNKVKRSMTEKTA